MDSTDLTLASSKNRKSNKNSQKVCYCFQASLNKYSSTFLYLITVKFRYTVKFFNGSYFFLDKIANISKKISHAENLRFKSLNVIDISMAVFGTKPGEWLAYFCRKKSSHFFKAFMKLKQNWLG